MAGPSGRTVLGRVACATSAWERARGLLGRPAPGPDEGLLLTPCRSVHTFGMRYPIDVVYLDDDWRIARVVPGLAPLRLSACRRAVATLEIAAGRAATIGLEPGDELRWNAA